MAAPTDIFDLGRLRLSSGEGRRLTLGVRLGDFDFGGERYAVEPPLVDATLDISRMTAGGYALRLRFDAGLIGPCMRCLEPAAPVTAVDVREVHQPGGGEELTSPYVTARTSTSAPGRTTPTRSRSRRRSLCTPDCAGLCPECGANLNTAGPEHHHDREPDPRWAKLRELRLD